MQNYFIGIDQGTSSLGVAVTDENYNLMKNPITNQDMWEVKLFSEANTALDRRLYRNGRRLVDKSKARCSYLKSIFEDAINKIDPEFFSRLQDSYFWEDDKTVSGKYSLFNDENFNDRDFHKLYPTIFHLKKELITSDDSFDPRLVYLALHYMMQHRGHFYSTVSGENMDVDILLSELADIYPNIPEINDSIIHDAKIRRKTKPVLLGGKNKQHVEFFKFILGMSGKPYLLFGENEVSEQFKTESLNFSSEDFDDNLMDASNYLSNTQIMTLGILKQLYNFYALEHIMQGEQYISDVKVKLYNKHKTDLRKLKAIIRKYYPEKYNFLFNTKEAGTYHAYIKRTKTNKNALTKNVFFKTIYSLLDAISNKNSDIENIMFDIDNDVFLPKQKTIDNSVIPNQIYETEMNVILMNASSYLDFLNETDESGLTAAQRILKIFTFHMPYYIGPTKGKNSWIVRKESGRIYPWNLEDKINVQETAIEFIKRMVGKCTYYKNEYSLPDNSILYEDFKVLNELNSISIDGIRISTELKQSIYKDLFLPCQQVTEKKFINYLIKKGIVTDDINYKERVKGIADKFNNQLTSYKKIKSIPELSEMLDDQIEIAEKIIFWVTVFGDNMDMTINKIENEYPLFFSKESLRKISKLKFSGYGNLSQKLLTIKGCDVETGEVGSIIGFMWNNSVNLQELLSGRYTFSQIIKEDNPENIISVLDLKYDILENYYLCPAVKKMIWKTIKTIQNIISKMGYEPKKIFIETTRSNQQKNIKTKDLKEQLRIIYSKNKKNIDPIVYNEFMNTPKEKFRDRKVYLYFQQLGKCMYSGDSIHYEDLKNSNIYDKDHIYPQHFTKDDSVNNNLVLVRKKLNLHKTDIYPIEDKVYNKMHDFWEKLYHYGLITNEKFSRLCCRQPFSDLQLAGFINRQLTETGSATKILASIFSKCFSESKTKVCYVKPSNVSEFRKEFNLLKSRNVNNLHHAEDAYLNIVVGNIFDVKFTTNPLNFIKEFKKDPKNNPYHIGKIYDRDVIRGKETAWIAGNENTIQTIYNVMDKNTASIYKKTEINDGQMWNATIYRKELTKPDVYFPIKTSDSRLAKMDRYGGVTSMATSFFTEIEYTNIKGNLVHHFVPITVYHANNIKNKKYTLKECLEMDGFKDFKIVNETVPKYKKIKDRATGSEYLISGKTCNYLTVWNCYQLYLDRESKNYCKKIENCIDREYINKDVTKEKNLKLYDILVYKYTKTKLGDKKNGIGKIIKEKREAFKELGIAKQCNVIYAILKYGLIGSPVADLTEIGGCKNSGIIKFPLYVF